MIHILYVIDAADTVVHYLIIKNVHFEILIQIHYHG